MIYLINNIYVYNLCPLLEFHVQNVRREVDTF
jgi:hypothetical protein